MRAIVAIAVLAAAVSATDLWQREPLEALDPVNFTVTNCGDPNTDYVVVKKAELKNLMPIKGGDYLEGAYAASIISTINAMSADVVVEKQMTKSMWIKVPCIDGVGSCSYADACSELEKIPADSCTKILGQECRCPLKATSIRDDNFKYGPVPNIPAVAHGNFRLTVKATETTTQKRVACYQVTISLK